MAKIDYKKMALILREEKAELTATVEMLEAEKNKAKASRYSCVVFCMNCRTVARVDIPMGAPILDSACWACGVKNTGYLVSKVLEVKL